MCDGLQWRAPNGRLKEVICRKALLELDRRGLIMLPPAQESCFKRSRPQPPIDRLIDPPEVRCALEELGEINIIAVTSRYSSSSRTWNALMERLRIPLKSAPIPKQSGTDCGTNRHSGKSERSDAGSLFIA